jgi:radical SAM superfamily enzyme YgiQ (UPF0313 family)
MQKLYETVKKRVSLEKRTSPPKSNAEISFALAFPNKYRLGMASLGFQIVYQLINNNPNAYCDRVFLPDEEEIPLYQKSKTQLFTYETLKSVNEFDVLGISLYFEMDYVNVLRLFSLVNIPLRASDRNENHPIIIAGGPCATFNPEPMAAFIDVFVVGDAEAVMDDIIDILLRFKYSTKQEKIEALSKLDGLYVPSLQVWNKQVKRSINKELDNYPGSSSIYTDEAEFGDLELIEVSRGCSRGCNFCAAGVIGRPIRSRKLDISKSDAKRFGLVGAAVFDHPDIIRFCYEIIDAGKQFTVSSIRLETITPITAELLFKGGQKTLTIAPEAGSERLRKVINKQCSDETIINAVEIAFKAGIKKIKLYFMIGLPTETDEDIKSAALLVKRLSSTYPKVSFQVSASCFVPKPLTAFQAEKIADTKILKSRLSILKKEIKLLRNTKLNTESPRLSIIQAILARGGRELADVIEKAFELDGNENQCLQYSMRQVIIKSK